MATETSYTAHSETAIRFSPEAALSTRQKTATTASSARYLAPIGLAAEIRRAAAKAVETTACTASATQTGRPTAYVFGEDGKTGLTAEAGRSLSPITAHNSATEKTAAAVPSPTAGRRSDAAFS